MTTAQMEADAKARGFESVDEFERCMARVDISSLVKYQAFVLWKNEDGTKTGLLPLLPKGFR